MSSRARVALVGHGSTTWSALEALHPHFELVGLVRPTEDDTSAWARARDVEVAAAPRPRDVADLVRRWSPDVVVVSSYDRILPAPMLDECPFVNVHYAPLPRYRGRATVNWAIVNGEEATAMTVHCLEPGLDAGGILAQVPVEIGPRDTVEHLYERLNDAQREHLPAAVRRRLSGDLGEAQDEAAATYCCTRLPEDGELSWAGTTTQSDRLVRSLGGPFPPAFTYLGAQRLDVLRAEPVPDAPVFEGRVPGRVQRIDRSSGHVEVLTGDGVLRLEVVGVDGEARRPADVISSVRLTLGRRTS